MGWPHGQIIDIRVFSMQVLFFGLEHYQIGKVSHLEKSYSITAPTNIILSGFTKLNGCRLDHYKICLIIFVLLILCLYFMFIGCMTIFLFFEK